MYKKTERAILKDSEKEIFETEDNKDNKVINKIKELLNGITKPENMSSLDNLVEKVLTEIQADYEYDNVDGDIIRKIIHDYFKARGWC